ncbi:MAG: adenylate/guanylate cyclase domain-containing protein [Hyphomicrobiales bacterium]
MTTKVRRRLTTVLSADVAGYARLMEFDEAGTLETLRRYRSAMAKLVERHEGRIVNTWGDAILAEFASVVEAVQCAVETQQELSTANDALPDAKKMRFRIGINLGDVIVAGDDVYGDGVNIAARLQQLAEPGGILISGPVYDQVHNKLSINFDPLGPQQVKNVSNPVMGYRVLSGNGPQPDRPLPNPSPVPPVGKQPQATGGEIRHWYRNVPRPILAICAIILFLFLINLFSGPDDIWFHWPALPLVLIVVLWAVFRSRKE